MHKCLPFSVARVPPKAVTLLGSTLHSLLLLAMSIVPVQACVTIVADQYGTVTAADTASAKPEERWPVQLLQCFSARKVLTLPVGARATLFFPATGIAFELRGPGRFEVTSDGVRPLADSLAPSQAALNTAFRDIKLDRANLAPAGVRMRDPSIVVGPALLEPRGMVVSAEPPVFRWEAIAGSPMYRFRLADTNMVVLFDTLTDRTELMLPAEIRLTPGERLLWHVEEASSMRRRANRWQEFVIATPDARALAQAIDRDIPSPSAAQRNLRDVLLMQRMARVKPEP